MPSIFIDDKKVDFDGTDETILDVARKGGIYIPTLCDHDELEPHGGCRMCIVEVEGMRGFPPSCATAAKDGMVVRTSTEDLLKLKRNILQLLLMEHPSACMVCEERERCSKYRPQPYKAGNITGCTTCSNRYTCDLRNVVDFLGIEELDYGPVYKETTVERSDPFFDRDYNLCILCARCIRVCEDVRGTSAITFVKRGHETRVDTAFGVSHLESGCWFCGACVDVCPTGALTARMTKWIGEPDSVEETTCVLCGMGCQTEFEVKWGKVMGSGPGRPESPPNHHHMCVVGRFCIPSLVNAADRIMAPQLKRDGEKVPVSWDEALDEVAAILREKEPQRVGFLGSPQMTVESAYLFGKLARVGIKTGNVDFQGSDFPALIHRELSKDQDFARIRTLDHLQDADWIVAVGGNFVKSQQVVAKEVYKAVAKGTPLIVLGEAGSNLRRWATEHVSMPSKKVGPLLVKLAEHKTTLQGVGRKQAERLVEITKTGKGATLVGPRILECKEPELALRSLIRLGGASGALFPLFPWGNEMGVIKAGLRPEMLPGPSSVTVKKAKASVKKAWGEGDFSDGLHLTEMRAKARKKQLDVLYVADGSISMDGFEKVPTIIYQSPYPSDWVDVASVILPSSTFVEESGTFVNLEMRSLKLHPIVRSPGAAREDWQIFAEIGKKVGAEGFSHEDSTKVWEELIHFTRNVEIGGQSRRDSWKPASSEKNEWYPRYRGADLPARIEDLAIFVDALDKRDEMAPAETMDEMVKRVSGGRAAHREEVG
ncbi:MAG: molybdopterin-dependent oxidoreductase [Candidatus Thorarchaeota archaeon]|nr:MAG: molybdopterin-dependent oxidoreductase [Candidatus Thorarchaeota archaeon]